MKYPYNCSLRLSFQNIILCYTRNATRQKQLPEVDLQKLCSEHFCKILRKIFSSRPAPLLKKDAGTGLYLSILQSFQKQFSDPLTVTRYKWLISRTTSINHFLLQSDSHKKTVTFCKNNSFSFLKFTYFPLHMENISKLLDKYKFYWSIDSGSVWSMWNEIDFKWLFFSKNVWF